MIDPDDIKKLLVVTNAVDPKLVFVIFQVVPVIDWIAPSLPGGAEIIRRHSGDENRPAVCIQEEIVLSTPDVHRIHTHIERHVSHDLNTTFVGTPFYFHPL